MRSRLTLENDDKVYTPADLLPVCTEMKVPLVYDVHHHRCLPDGLSVEAATEKADQPGRFLRTVFAFAHASLLTLALHHDYTLEPRFFA